MHEAFEKCAACLQVHTLQSELAAQRTVVEAAHHEQAESAEFIAKLEADLASLSEAYHDLQHAQSTADDHQAVNGSHEQHTSSAPQAAGTSDGNEHLAQLLEARQEMDDLLVCLGQEEQKVETLLDKLQALGVDGSTLIAHIGDGGSQEGSVAGEAVLHGQQTGDVHVTSWLDGAHIDTPG